MSVFCVSYSKDKMQSQDKEGQLKYREQKNQSRYSDLLRDGRSRDRIPVGAIGRSQWPSGLRRGSAADRLLGLRVRIPPGAWIFVVCCKKSQNAGQSRQRNKYG